MSGKLPPDVGIGAVRGRSRNQRRQRSPRARLARLFAGAGALALTAVVPVVIGAQQPAPSDSAKRDSLRAFPLAPVVVTATQVPTAQSQVGFATSVLDSSTLAAEPTPFASQALTFLPGISIEEGAGPEAPTVLHIRGGDQPFTEMLMDGVPMNISGGYNDMEGLLLTNVERVEVARGPMSAIWGASAMSGAVQFITREGPVGPPQLDVEAEGGSAATYNDQGHAEVDVAGGSEHVRYSSGLGFAYNRGIYVAPNNLLSGDGSARLDATLSDRVSLTATARYRVFQTNLPVRTPGLVVPFDSGQGDGDHRWQGAVTGDWAASPTWHHRLTAQVLWDDFNYREQIDSGVPAADAALFPNYDLRYKSTLARPGVEYVGTNEFGIGRARLIPSYGASWQEESEVDQQAGTYSSPQGTSGASTSSYHRSNEGLFAELQSVVGRLSLLAGARLEKFEGLASVVVPRGSVVLTVVPHWLALRAAAGRAFEVPNLSQQYTSNPSFVSNPNLQPTQSGSWELGTNVNNPARTITFGLGYFHQHVTGLIENVPVDTGAITTDKNVGATQYEGVETELERHWANGWRTGVNLTWVKTEILDNTGLDPTAYPIGGSLPAIPSVTGSVYASGDVSRSVSALARVTIVGDQTVFTNQFSGPRTTVAAYALLDGVIRWHASHATDLYLRVGNLLNSTYYLAYARPGIPRTVVLGARAALGGARD